MQKRESVNEKQTEETLDTNDWKKIKETGLRMTEEMIDFLQTIREKPVWAKPPQSVKNHFKERLPRSAQSLEQVYEEFKENILPYYTGNIHPRFWGWVMGTGSAQAMLAEMLAAGMNSNLGIGDQSAMYVDQQVINWCKEMMGFPKNSSGALVSGASAANLNALIVARNSVNKYIRQCGIQVFSGKLVMYASAETHSCILKAAEIMGIGNEGVRKVNVNDKYEMDVNHLKELIKVDKLLGNTPFCVVANVGTVNTGAIDPLEEIYSVTLEHRLWFHIDGAFGALLKLLPEYKEKLQCIELADSIAFDLHKWMYLPYEAGVVLVRDANKHRQAFALQPDYLSDQGGGIAAGPESTSNFGFDLSRNFKALKVWMSLKEQGIGKFERLIRQNVRQASYLGGIVFKNLSLELMSPVSMNIVCFRYNPGYIKEDELNELNKEILVRLQEEGIAVPSNTTLNGKYCMRVAIVNHRSRREDFDLLVKEVLRIGAAIEKEKSKQYTMTDNATIAESTIDC